ncbi:DUF4017 family protein [Heyndrickxia sporothermodurans]
MKKFIIPFVAYLIVSIGSVLYPASDGYNTIGWKLFVGQFIAIPVFIVIALVTFFANKRLSHR